MHSVAMLAALGICAIWSTSAEAGLICHERSGHYGCRQVCRPYHDHFGLVTGGLTHIDTADFVGVGRRARTERGAEADLKGICTGIENERGGAAAARSPGIQ